MPKLKPSEAELKNRTVRGLILKNMEVCNIKEEELACKAMFTSRTLRNKMKRPETFTLRELRAICKALNFTTDEKAQVL